MAEGRDSAHSRRRRCVDGGRPLADRPTRVRLRGERPSRRALGRGPSEPDDARRLRYAQLGDRDQESRRVATRGLASCLGFLLILPLTVGAQRTVRIDAGSGRMRFSDSIAATTFSFSPSFRVTTARASVSGSGTFARLEGATSNSGLLDATLRLLDRGALAMDGNLFAGGSRHSDGARTGQMLGSIRFHAVATSRGAWLGAGVGRTWDGTWRNVAQLEATGWLVAGPSLLSAIVTPTIVDDTIRYADSFVAARYAVQRWEIDGSIGIRAGGRVAVLSTTRSSWGSVGATFWATPHVGINAAAGTYPVDFTQGFPGGQYVLLNARLRWSDRALPNPPAPRDLATPADEVAAFEIRRLDDGRQSV